jgi:hypothetical protein
LAEYTATRLLDSMFANEFVINVNEELTASDIYKNLKNCVTKDIIFSNIKQFNDHLNGLVFNRLNYLWEEGIVYVDEQLNYKVRTEQEIEEFCNVD